MLLNEEEKMTIVKYIFGSEIIPDGALLPDPTEKPKVSAEIEKEEIGTKAEHGEVIEGRIIEEREPVEPADELLKDSANQQNVDEQIEEVIAEKNKQKFRLRYRRQINKIWKLNHK